MKFHRYTPGAMLAALVAAGLLMSGCGNLKAPLAPGLAPPGQAYTIQQAARNFSTDDAPFAIVLSPRGIDPSKRSFKPTVAQTVSGPFTATGGGTLTTSLPDSSGGVRLKTATFVVVGGSLSQDKTISMKAMCGSVLTDIGVIFTPSGTSFSPPAVLTMLVKGPVSDAEIAALTAYHIHGGTSEAIPFQAVRTGTNEVTFTVQVPGFSSYSLGDDQFPPEPGP